jgi:hypothetical protein
MVQKLHDLMIRNLFKCLLWCGEITLYVQVACDRERDTKKRQHKIEHEYMQKVKRQRAIERKL